MIVLLNDRNDPSHLNQFTSIVFSLSPHRHTTTTERTETELSSGCTTECDDAKAVYWHKCKIHAAQYADG